MITERNVATRSDTVQKMIERAHMPRTLAGGTAAMRDAKEKYLPREEAETDDAYKARIARSVLFGAFAKTIEDMTGKVFRKPITFENDVPSVLIKHVEDIDLTGRHINVFARDVFIDAFVTGIHFIFTDMQTAPTRDDGRPTTLRDEQRAGLRPYLVSIPLERMLGWKSETISGAEVLTQLRYMEYVTENDGPWHTKDIEQVRVIEPGRWETYRKNEKGDWVQYNAGTYKLNKITCAAVYTGRTGFMTAVCPLEKLAELNVNHWQKSSDLDNIAHVVNVPILFGAGIGEDEKLVIGAGSMVRCSSPDAKLEYVTHDGAAITVTRDLLKDLEFRMQTMGLQLLIKPSGQSATGEVRDDEKENSPLAMMARSLQDALETSFGYMAEYIDLGEDKGGSIVVNTDFGIRAGASQDAQLLLDAVNAGAISKETFWSEWQRRGILSDSFDVETEQDKIDSQPPDLDAGKGNGMDLGASDEA